MSSARQLLLVGASGFAGPWIAGAAIAAGWHVIGLSRRPGASAEGYTARTGDATDPRSWEAPLAEADAVVFNAAHVPADHGLAVEAELCTRTNALAPLAMLQSIARRPRPFIYISGAQGYAALDRPATETDPFFPSGHAAYYLGSKLLGDLFTEHHRTVYGVPTSVLRLGSLYGPGLQRGMIARFVAQAYRGETIVLQDGGRHRVDLTFVGDAGKAVVAVLERRTTGVFNVASGEWSSALDAARAVLTASGRPETLLRIEPARDGPPGGFAAVDIGRARRELGFRPTELREGIGRTVREWTSS
jgi:UDP-glucose 4-epimerase